MVSIRTSIHRALGAALATMAALLLLAPAAEADKRVFKPVHVGSNSVKFDVSALEPQQVRRGRIVLRRAGPRRAYRRHVGSWRLRRAVESGGNLEVRRPRRARQGRLAVSVAPVEAPAAGGECSSVLGGEAEACRVLFDDTADVKDADSVWGSIECATDARHSLIGELGDSFPSATGEAQADSSYRSLQVLDGDDYYGERCELGRNDHRSGPTALFREGERRITHASFRLPQSLPLETSAWQVVMQMKQSQPSANGGGTPVLSLEVRDGMWRLMQSTSVESSSDTRELWSAPARRGVWTRFAFDVLYSQDESKGSIQVHADLNADGDTVDESETSDVFRTYTLKRELSGGSPTDGIDPGESIPSHLRVGLYHNPSISCPPPTGCSVDVDNVQVLEPAAA